VLNCPVPWRAVNPATATPKPDRAAQPTPPQTSGTAQVAPSFPPRGDGLDDWCAKIRLPSSIAICSEPELRRLVLDRQRAYDEVKAKLTPEQRKALLADQNGWVKSYPASCGLAADEPPSIPLASTVRDCMAQAGRARIAYLRAYGEAPVNAPPPTQAAAPPAAPLRITTVAPAPSPNATPAAPPTTCPNGFHDNGFGCLRNYVTPSQATPSTSSATTPRPEGRDTTESVLICFLIVAGVVAAVVYVYTRQKNAKARSAAIDWMRMTLLQGTTIRLTCGPTPNVNFHDDEEFLSVFPETTLTEPRAVRTSRGIYGGPSFRIAKGVYFRLGGYRGTSESHEELRGIDSGTLVITNQRLIFVGSFRTISFPLADIIGSVAYLRSLELHRKGKQRTEYFNFSKNLEMTYNRDGETRSAPVDAVMIKLVIDQAYLYKDHPEFVGLSQDDINNLQTIPSDTLNSLQESGLLSQDNLKLTSTLSQGALNSIAAMSRCGDAAEITILKPIDEVLKPGEPDHRRCRHLRTGMTIAEARGIEGGPTIADLAALTKLDAIALRCIETKA
jgi:uncharacterized protein YecT (DUF1311 family)